MTHEEINDLKNTQKNSSSSIYDITSMKKWDLANNLSDSKQEEQVEDNVEESRWSFIIPPTDTRNFRWQ